LKTEPLFYKNSSIFSKEWDSTLKNLESLEMCEYSDSFPFLGVGKLILELLSHFAFYFVDSFANVCMYNVFLSCNKYVCLSYELDDANESIK